MTDPNRTGSQHSVNPETMTHQAIPTNPTHTLKVPAAKSILSIVTLRAGLTALLLWSGSGAIAIPTLANPHPRTFLTAQVPAGANIIYVNSQTGNDNAGSGNSEATPYRTITFALAQAQAGTIVQLAPGSYIAEKGEIFPLKVPNGVILRGDEARKGRTVVIIGGGDYLSPSFARQSITLVAQNSEIRGLTISNPNKRGTGVWIESGSPTLSNNTFSGNKREGVFISGNAVPKIENNIFRDNDANGISVAKSAQGEIRGNLFVNTGFGIAVGGTASPLIAENRIVQNTDGMYINESARPVLRNNVIQNNKRDGVVVTINAQPDLGTTENPGNNIILNNGKFDLNNGTTSNTLSAVGNNINSSRISGRVAFVFVDVKPPSGGTVTFADVEGHWAQAYIEALASRGIIAGFSDGTFRPSDSVNRAQFAVIISKAFAPTPQRPAVNFVDVKNNFWAYLPIQAAYRGGFLSGYDNRRFRPEQPITRVQAIVGLVSGLKLPTGDASVLSFYKDAAQIPNYATAAVAAATKQQLVVNFPQPNQLNPNQVLTRADVAAFIYQALVNAGKLEAISSPYLVTVTPGVER